MLGQTETIILTPRPWATLAGKLTIVPLLPHTIEQTTLPPELWIKVLTFVVGDPNIATLDLKRQRSLMTVCKLFRSIVAPMFYAKPNLTTLESFHLLVALLQDRDIQPIGLDRIPYSIPGRWIQTLDLSKLPHIPPREALGVDINLSRFFNVTPFLTTIKLTENIRLSRRAIEALADSECAAYLRHLSGIPLPTPFLFYREASQIQEDPIARLLARTPALEQLTLVGPGYLDEAFQADVASTLSNLPPMPILYLPDLHHLSIVGLFGAGIMLILAISPLPSLRSLTVTRFDFFPPHSTFLPYLMGAHSEQLSSLHYLPPAAMFSRVALLPTPDFSLRQFPHLTHLSLSGSSPLISPTINHHPLRCLSVPKPSPVLLEEIERVRVHLPNLKYIQLRDVKWLPTALNAHARASGVPGEMARWKRRLGTRGIVVLDSDGKASSS